MFTVFVSYNRLDLLKQTIASYVETVEQPMSGLVVDNGSNAETIEWLRTKCPFLVEYLGYNSYPGRACNLGFAKAPRDATYLHRSDNDMLYLPGWQEAVMERFQQKWVGQVGLRTDEEERFNRLNVGGTAVFGRHLWDKGLRYREEPWSKLGTMTEDYWISRQVLKMGWNWTRVQRPCVVHLASGDLNDPYYQESYGVRGI